MSAPVNHISLAAYTAELFALAVAITLAPARVRIFTDCKTIVDLLYATLHQDCVSPQWSHAPLWRAILTVWRRKSCSCEHRVHVQWLPAHTCDRRPLEQIGLHESFPGGFWGWQLRANRRADEEAKRVAKQHAAFQVDMWPMVFHAAWTRQEALVKLNQIIGSDAVVKKVFQTKEEDIHQHTDDECRSRFPSWDWTPNSALYTWTPQPECSGAQHIQQLCDHDDADQFLTFLHSFQ